MPDVAMDAKADHQVDGSCSLTVLHVDDDPMNLRVVHEILTAFGCTSRQANSGAEALEQLRGPQVFDVVLMDINMPGMTGIEVVRRLRDSAGQERDTPVIALTSVWRSKVEYLALGFDDFVSKPILVRELYASLIVHAVGRRERPLFARR